MVGITGILSEQDVENSGVLPWKCGYEKIGELWDWGVYQG